VKIFTDAVDHQRSILVSTSEEIQMPSPRTQAEILARLRLAWHEHLASADGELTWEDAEEFLASAQEVVRTLAEELKTRLELGVAEEVRVYFDPDMCEWRVAVYLTDGRRRRVPLAEYYTMPPVTTDDVLRRAVIEAAFIHNVALEPHDVEIEDECASWGRCSTWDRHV
jgi:hypothetical protein